MSKIDLKNDQKINTFSDPILDAFWTSWGPPGRRETWFYLRDLMVFVKFTFRKKIRFWSEKVRFWDPKRRPKVIKNGSKNRSFFGCVFLAKLIPKSEKVCVIGVIGQGTAACAEPVGDYRGRLNVSIRVSLRQTS